MMMLLRSAKQQFRFSTANWSSFRVQIIGNRNRFAGFLPGNPSRLLPRICKNATSLITVPIRRLPFPKESTAWYYPNPHPIDIRIHWYPPRRTLNRQDIYRSTVIDWCPSQTLHDQAISLYKGLRVFHNRRILVILPFSKRGEVHNNIRVYGYPFQLGFMGNMLSLYPYHQLE
jgi:hypothetical protein